MTVYLPLGAVGYAQASLERADERPLAKKGKETVLLGKDDDAVRRIIRVMLQENGYDVIEAANGQEALEKFPDNKEQIGIVLLDVIMPRMSGVEAFKRMKQVNADLKAVFMSGYTADALQRKNVSEDGVDFIAKHVTRENPLGILTKALD